MKLKKRSKKHDNLDPNKLVMESFLIQVGCVLLLLIILVVLEWLFPQLNM